VAVTAAPVSDLTSLKVVAFKVVGFMASEKLTKTFVFAATEFAPACG
jgi:hypothetical protein